MYVNLVLFERDGSGGQGELWATDGTSAWEITNGNSAPGSFLDPASLTPFGSEMLFVGHDANNRSQLWVTDGTAAGTSELPITSKVASASGFTLLGNRSCLPAVTDSTRISG